MQSKTINTSSGAARMRLLRERRREGAICVTVEVFRCEIDRLVRQGLLRPDQKLDRDAVASAIGKLIEIWFRSGFVC
jgi:hypothetical protein